MHIMISLLIWSAPKTTGNPFNDRFPDQFGFDLFSARMSRENHRSANLLLRYISLWSSLRLKFWKEKENFEINEERILEIAIEKFIYINKFDLLGCNIIIHSASQSLRKTVLSQLPTGRKLYDMPYHFR